MPSTILYTFHQRPCGLKCSMVSPTLVQDLAAALSLGVFVMHSRIRRRRVLCKGNPLACAGLAVPGEGVQSHFT